MLQKFGSNLSFKLDGNSVISMNNVQRTCYIAGDLRFGSRRARGRPRLHVGAEKSLVWLPCTSEPRYLALAVAICPRSLALFSSRRLVHLRRALTVEPMTLPSQQSIR